MLRFLLIPMMAGVMLANCETSVDPEPPNDPVISETPGTNPPGSGPVDPDPVEPDPVEPDPVEDISINFTPNDVSILFPAPKTSTELQSVGLRLTDFRSDRVLPENKFRQVMQLVTGTSTLTTPNGPLQVDAGAIPGTGNRDPQTGNLIPGTERRIKFPNDNRRRDWLVAGMRIDPGAPGLTGDIFRNFGKSPQIRLTLQPVTETGGDVQITDGSLHLVYAFHGTPNPQARAQCFLHNTPDMNGFKKAVEDLKAIRDKFAARGVNTSGPMNVHPAFANHGSDFRDDMKTYFDAHLSPDRLFAVSIAGIPLPDPEPWVFLAMKENPLSGQLEAVPGPAIVQPGGLPKFGQMISFIDSPQIVPAPAARNRQAIDCGLNFPGPVPTAVPGAGFSTAEVFDQGATNISAIAETVADPARSHFFNTDCVSCHTETRKEIDMGRSSESIIGDRVGIDPTVMPKERWNVRAFGWFPGFFNQVSSGAHETITRRTATETAEVVHCFKEGKWDSVNESCLR